MSRNPGDSIVLRSIVDQRVRSLVSLTVVEDQPDIVALYIAPGYPCKRPEGTRGGPRNRVLILDNGRREDFAWAHNRMLMLHRPGDAHSVQLFWDAADSRFLCWYIDLQQPFHRTPIGFDSRDHVLDVVVAPDRSSWKWKDEDELEWHLANGRLSSEQARLIRSEGEHAVERLTVTDPAFYQRWRDWSPDPSWVVPEIPADWKLIFSHSDQNGGRS